MMTDDNIDDDDILASFAYVLSKEKIDDYKRQAETFFGIVLGGSMEKLITRIHNNLNYEEDSTLEEPCTKLTT